MSGHHKIQPLPRSLDPLPGESLTGYVLRLAHRLNLPPARVATLTGLASTVGALPAGRLVALEPHTVETFSHATRLTRAEVTALTLTSLSAYYPFLDPAFTGRRRHIHGIAIKETWVFFRATRYCPDCLAGDGSPIQNRHGGPWKLHWRLPIAFACTTHRRLLEHTCPACRQPAQGRAGPGKQLVSLAKREPLHPAQCRSPISIDDTGHRHDACGHRLDTTSKNDLVSRQIGELLALQTHLLGLLQAGSTTALSSAGEPTTPQRYLVDLRLLTCLITASWPVAKEFFDDQPQHARFVHDHVAEIRCRIDAVQRSGRAVRKIAFYDTPPLNSHTCAALLATADWLLTTDNPSRLRESLRPLIANTPAGMQQWSRQFLHGAGYCSPGLQAALGVEIGNQHVIKRLGIAVPQPVSPPPQPVRFGVEHIPAHLLPEWHTEYLAGFTDEVKPRLLRRAAAARLAQLCAGGPAAIAGQQLDIPREASLNALNVIRRQLTRRRQQAFDTAVDAIAERLNNTTDLIDYGTRRDALAHWRLTPREWDQLTNDLRRESEHRASRWPDTSWIDWGESKRLLASMWIWVHLTDGEHIFAPAIRPDPDLTRPGGRGLAQIHSRWRLISADNPRGHYAALRAQITPYADQLLHTIEADSLQHRNR